MKLFNLALANIRKGKSAAISLFILIMIATLLLNIGLMVITKMDTFYDDKVKQLHDPHVSIIMSSRDYKQAYSDFLEQRAGVEHFEMESIVFMPSTKIRYGNNDTDSASVLVNADREKYFSPLQFVERLDDSQRYDIYMPLSFKVSGGYKLGDSYTITYQDKAYTYRIAGFFEVTMLGMNNMGIIKYMLPSAAYEELSNQLGEEAAGVMMNASLKDSVQSTAVLSAFNKKFPQLSKEGAIPTYREGNIEFTKSSNGITINIIAMILVAFAAVVLLVSLIVIKSRVNDSIEDAIVNIGILKAVGYTSSQIVYSINLQFICITTIAGLVGTSISYLLIPVFGIVVSTMSGLLWINGFNPTVNLVSILIVVILVPLVTLLSSLQIRKLHPVTALRGGLTTHSFKKNFIPLEKSKGALQFMLACKTILMNRKQNVMITAIITAITFTSVFAIVLYYNVAVDNKAFIHLVGAETSNVSILVKTESDNKKLIEHLNQLDRVKKTSMLDLIATKVEGDKVYTNISDDFSKLDNQTVFEGRYPKYDNEIALSWVVANNHHKKIGDTVKVEVGNTAYEYLITGLSQSIGNIGQAAQLTLSGVKHMIPDYKQLSTKVYLQGVDNQSFIQAMKEQYGTVIQKITDVDEAINSSSDVYISAVFAVMVMIIVIAILVVVLLLYLVIKTMIIRRKKEFGILKAIGYTTLQLMNQIALSFVPIVIIGAAIGGVLGYFYTNAMLTVLLSSIGSHSVHFVVKGPLIFFLCVGLVVMAYLVSMLVARRIKRISAYGLIVE